jgi:class 3 adenylate cyclase
VPHEGARFCDACGSPLLPVVDAAEYKQVTVLFADVVRSMDIAAALDIERLREIMTELVNRCAAVVLRYGGTVDKFTGDGIMALFGAPMALEDHAVRACLAALQIQHEAARLATDVERRDGRALQLRVGLNSGLVIAGEIGSESLGYTAVGEQVGLAQRMESVAPPGWVMLSESTARLVEHAAVLGEPEWVRIKGADAPVPARRLLGMRPGHAVVARQEASLVGRRWEMATLDAMVDRTIGGRGGVVNVTGAPGIGKSRIAREAAAAAAARGVEVFWAFCESHAREVPFHAVRRLLRAVNGIEDLDGKAARARVREQVPDAEAQDLLLLDDLLGIADPDVPLPQIDPDARRRRLTALINTASLARAEPALYLIEDAQWVDAVSESMLADFLTVIPQTKLMVLITSRPEYEGALTRVHGAQTIALAPLGDSDTAALIGELLGSDPSVGELVAIIAERAAGNPFFAEEMVRELAQRGVLAGEHGGYVCRVEVAEVAVPATVQAAIEARIDRLTAPVKRTVNAASVIGARFGSPLLAALGIDAMLDELLSAELIDQVRFTPHAEYAFRHPLIRAVAYESQLKSDRAEVHRRLAAAIELGSPESADRNAALIAEHLEAAGELRAAYGWHMRAGAWSTSRNITAAVTSWRRARAVADRLPSEESDRLAMRIAPRTLLTANVWHVGGSGADTGFEELRDLCTAAGDKRSLAIGMAGPLIAHSFNCRLREGSQLASEYFTLLESLGEPTLTVGLSSAAILAKHEAGDMADQLQLTQRVIDLAEGEPAMGANLILGSPLAYALVHRGTARWCLGQPGWREDYQQAVDLARGADPGTHALTVFYKYTPAIPSGVFLPGDAALAEITESMQRAERAEDDVAVALMRAALANALLHSKSPDWDRGLTMATQVLDAALGGRFSLLGVPLEQGFITWAKGRRAGRGGDVSTLRAAVDQLFDWGSFTWCIPATKWLVESMLTDPDVDDVQEAQAAIDRLANAPADDGFVARDIMLLRLRALLAQAHGDDVVYRELVSRYRAMAKSLGFEGHIAMAEAM